MQTRITARHFKANSDLHHHAVSTVKKLEKYYDGITDAHVILDVDEAPANEKLAEISLHVYRQTLTARDTAPTHREAINRCVSSLRRQILRYKERLRGKTRNGRSKSLIEPSL